MAEGTTMCDRKESGIRTAGRKPDQIGSYFVTEWKPLLAVTVSGLITGQDLKEQLRVLLAKGSCKNITKEEVHELVDEIYADYEQR